VDGRVAAADGTSQWITGAAARADVHRLRAECDTVLVGVGTVRSDDPWLTARDASGVPLPRQPLRVVVDSTGRTPETARVRDGSAPTWIASAAEVGDDGAGRVDLRRLLTELFSRERRHVLVEGGPTLAGALVAAGLVDRVVAYIAPLLLGAGLPALGAAGVSTLDGAPRWRLADVTRFGDDLRLTLEPPDARPDDPRR
jgi:diaminohydroxyphosphoribosylaminopyrimidine deaminase/5-amino-6-(5-phosphoribosylamino)uracil reductase